MSMQQQTDSRDRLNIASWLVIWGAVVVAGEHAQFTLTYVAGVVWPEVKQLVLIPHARIHFFMAGIYAIIGQILLGVIARTLLKEDGALDGTLCCLLSSSVAGLIW